VSREALEAFEWIVRQAWSPSPTMPSGMDEKAELVRNALAEPPGVDAEHFHRVMSQLGKAACRVDDLVILCKRLSRALKSHNPGHPLHIELADYLRREGLTGSPMRPGKAEAPRAPVCTYPDCSCPIDKGEVCAADKAKADRRKPCTCHATSRGPGRPCAVKSGNALGELWRCVEEAEAPKAEPVALPRVYGVGRDAEYPRALLVDFDRVPTDDELRALHDLVRSPPAPQPVELSDAEIIAIRDEHLPAQGEPFDCIAFARAVLAQGRKG